MPFRDAWLLIGSFLILVGFGVAEPVIAGVGFVVLVIGGVSRFWSRHLFDRVTLTTKLSERRAFIGERVKMNVELENRKVLPLPWYSWRHAVAEQLAVPGEDLAASAAPGSSWITRRGALGWYEKHEWTFEIEPLERGFHPIGPSTIRSGDLLGIFPGMRENNDAQHLVVFPKVHRMEDLGLAADRPLGMVRGRNKLFEDPVRIAGLRDYRPGDPLRRIDWKASARSGDLQSRVYEPSAEQQLYVMVNIDTMEHAWEGYLRDELERTVSTAASIATWAAANRFAVGLLANGAYPNADRPIRLAPSRARDQITRVLEALAVVQPLTMGDLAVQIRREAGRMPVGSTIVVIASLIPPSLAGAILRLRTEGNHVAVIATSERVDPASLPGISFQTVARAFQRMEAVE